MPITFSDDRAVFEGICAVQEAEGLLSWVLEHPGAPVDTAACEHLHSAVLQVLMARRPPIVALPPEGPLQQVLQPLANP
ncbi:MAG: hypothetical protein FGM40_05895 [Rhodocyclaceae bacterium]|nr:hypothetical protein [Rhodocyclaceae bacterium]